MPQLLYTIEEYAATIRQKDTFFIVFNTTYNDVHGLHKKLDDIGGRYLDKDKTDNNAREEFLSFMKEHFSEVKLFEVFDLVSLGYLQWPYLGSIAIDTDKGSEAYEALSKKYGDPYGDATVNNAVLWVINYDYAKKYHEERKACLDAEFGDD